MEVFFSEGVERAVVSEAFNASSAASLRRDARVGVRRSREMRGFTVIFLLISTFRGDRKLTFFAIITLLILIR